jgi:hypothetical protein
LGTGFHGGKSSKAVARRRMIRKFRASRGMVRKSFWIRLDMVVRHPVTLLILGFVLTAILGRMIQDRLDTNEKNREEVRAAYQAMRTVDQAMEEVKVRAHIFIARRSAPDAPELREALDEAILRENMTFRAQWEAIWKPLGPEGDSTIMVGNAEEYVFESIDELSRRLDSLPKDAKLYNNDVENYLDSVDNCIQLAFTPYRESYEQSDPRARRAMFDDMIESDHKAVKSGQFGKGCKPLEVW